jgi:4-amino-4-deoxy-L-arabinose transferase-like glycosyltransferase
MIWNAAPPSAPPVRRRWWSLWLGALAIRLAAAVVTGGLWHPELNEYDSIARTLVRGGGFLYYHIGVPYYSYAPPLDAWIAAASYWSTGSIVPVMVLQCCVGAALAVVAAALAARLFDDWRASAAAGVLVALNPGLIYYNATKSHPLTFDALFFALTLLMVFRLSERPGIGRAIALGAVVGVGSLSRGTIGIFLPITGLWLLTVRPVRTWPGVVGHMTAAALVAAAIVGPWTVRNSLLHHKFVFILTTDSEDFWRGNNPNATGHSYVAPGQLVVTSIPPQDLAELQRQPNELAQAQWFSDRAGAFVRQHPRRFVELTLAKFYYFWWFAPQTGVLYSRAALNIYKTYYAFALALALAGAWHALRARSPMPSRALLLVLFLVTLSALQSLFYVEGRHRWAVEPMLLALSGGGVAMVLSARRPRAARP